MMYAELAKLELSGLVLDIGGDLRSGYHKLIGGTHTFETVNLEPKANPDYMFDLEQKFPLESRVFDAVVCLNVLEHIYNYEQMLAECVRVLKSGGQAVFAVPFLVQVHPSPHDYFRYTGESLERLFNKAGFSNVKVIPLGQGPFTASLQVAHNALSKVPLLALASMVLVAIFDKCIRFLDRKRTFDPNHYPLGYMVISEM